MTSMLPPTRDLPPGRQARIRAQLENAVGGRRRAFAKPLLAGAATVTAIVAAVAFLMPGQETVEQALRPAPFTTVLTSEPDFGIPAEEVRKIEEGCARSAGTGQTSILRQLHDDQIRWALLQGERELLICNIGVGGMEYNSAFAQRPTTAIDDAPISLGYSGASSGGDGGKPQYAGVPGYRTVAGYLDPKRIARVTYTVDGRTVEATIANGTFAARIFYPSNWEIPSTLDSGVVHAYDAQGTLIRTI